MLWKCEIRSLKSDDTSRFPYICHLATMMNLSFSFLVFLQKDVYAAGWFWWISFERNPRNASCALNLISTSLWRVRIIFLACIFVNIFGLPLSGFESTPLVHVFAKCPSCNKTIGITKNWTSFLRRNRSGHHNTELKTWKHIIWPNAQHESH